MMILLKTVGADFSPTVFLLEKLMSGDSRSQSYLMLSVA